MFSLSSPRLKRNPAHEQSAKARIARANILTWRIRAERSVGCGTLPYNFAPCEVVECVPFSDKTLEHVAKNQQGQTRPLLNLRGVESKIGVAPVVHTTRTTL